MDQIKIAMTEPRSWARRLTITVPAERVLRERDAVARRLASGIKLPGFRKGRVPADVMEKRYGASIEQQAVERLVGTAYREALQEKGLQPISQAEVGRVEYRAGTDLVFDVEFDVQPEILLERIEGFEVERESPGVSEDEVERVLERLRGEQATWSPIDGPPSDGDLAEVEITPLEEEAGESRPESRRYEVVIGEEQILPEIEAALREMSAGEESDRTLHVEREEGGSREHGVRLKLLGVKHPELPALDDDFAASVGDFASLDALRERVREDLAREAESEAERNVRRQLIDRILEANPFEAPESMVLRYLEGIFPAREGDELERLGEMRAAARPAAERALKRMLVLERIATEHGLRATDEEVDARVGLIAERNDRTPAQVRAELRKQERLDSIRESITEEKVFEFLKSRSTIK